MDPTAQDQTRSRSCRRYVVRGLVQRVGFRAFVTAHARRLGVAGHVFNRDDGAVELIAEGTVAELTDLERELRRGPPLSRVDEVTVNEEVATGRSGFEVRR